MVEEVNAGDRREDTDNDKRQETADIDSGATRGFRCGLGDAEGVDKGVGEEEEKLHEHRKDTRKLW